MVQANLLGYQFGDMAKVFGVVGVCVYGMNGLESILNF